MKQGIFAVLITFALVAAPALAQRTPERIINYPDLPVATASGKPLQAEQVKQAIVDAAARARLWTLAYEPNGTILATRAWNDHVIVVAIAYSPTQYSLVYRDSTNMKYKADGSSSITNSTINSFRNTYAGPAGAVIHPFYNRYVGELKNAIATELRKL
jgi:hypothetical protein